MIFLYHRVIADDAPAGRAWSTQTLRLSAFRRHLAWLARRFRTVPLAEYLQSRRPWSRRLAALTIDDGLSRTVQLVMPELRDRRLSATVFLPTAHFSDREVYWFSYLDALCFESDRPCIEFRNSMHLLGTDDERRRCRRLLGNLTREHGRPADFIRELRQRYPLSPGLIGEYRSLEPEEVRAAASTGRVEFGSHSVTHPYLHMLSSQEQVEEIAGSRQALEQVTSQPVPYFAYPAGAYNRDSIAAARAAGFSAAFACVPNRPRVDHSFELGRVGVYAPSMPKLVAKTFGAAHVLRALNIAAG